MVKKRLKIGRKMTKILIIFHKKKKGNQRPGVECHVYGILPLLDCANIIIDSGGVVCTMID